MGGFQVTLLLARRRHMVCWCVSTHTLLPVRGTNQWHTGCTGGVDKWNERGRRSGGHSSIEEYAAKGSSAFSSTHTQNYVFSHDAVPRTGGPLQHDGVAGTKMSAAGAAALLRPRHMHTELGDSCAHVDRGLPGQAHRQPHRTPRRPMQCNTKLGDLRLEERSYRYL